MCWEFRCPKACVLKAHTDRREDIGARCASGTGYCCTWRHLLDKCALLNTPEANAFATNTSLCVRFTRPHVRYLITWPVAGLICSSNVLIHKTGCNSLTRCTRPNKWSLPITVATRSRAWVWIPLKAWMFDVCRCCAVLCRHRPCEGLTTRLRRLAMSKNNFPKPQKEGPSF
jgi:hypothetical protein